MTLDKKQVLCLQIFEKLKYAFNDSILIIL